LETKNKIRNDMERLKQFSKKYGVARLMEDYLSLVKKYMKKNSVILDAGCGEGGVFSKSELNKKSKRKVLMGIDLGKSKNLYVDKKYFGSLDKLPFKDNCFDIIVCEWVAEHLEYSESVFTEFSRVLKKGGHLVLFTPNVLNPLVFFSKIISSKLKDAILTRFLHKREDDLFPVFLRCNSVRKIRKLAKKTNFNNEFTKTYYNPEYFIFNKTLLKFVIYLDRLFIKFKLFNFAKMYILVSYMNNKKLSGSVGRL
jgi:SAM-dependent methyltransferase